MVHIASVISLSLVVLTAACVATETENIMDLRQYSKSTSTTASPLRTAAAFAMQRKRNNYRAILREGDLMGDRMSKLSKRMMSKFAKINQMKGLSSRKKKKLKAFALRSAAVKRENKRYRMMARTQNVGPLKMTPLAKKKIK